MWSSVLQHPVQTMASGEEGRREGGKEGRREEGQGVRSYQLHISLFPLSPSLPPSLSPYQDQ